MLICWIYVILDVEGKILVEDIVKFGMVLEVIDGDFDVDIIYDFKVLKEWYI